MNVSWYDWVYQTDKLNVLIRMIIVLVGNISDDYKKVT